MQIMVMLNIVMLNIVVLNTVMLNDMLNIVILSMLALTCQLGQILSRKFGINLLTVFAKLQHFTAIIT